MSPQALEVLFEDEHLLAISKPRAMHSVRQRPEDPTTVADLIARHAPVCVAAAPNPLEAGLVQRLDYFTSGLMLSAKTPEIWRALHAALLDGRVEKTYIALVQSVLQRPQFVRLPIEQTKSGKRMKVVKGARAAEAQNKKGVFLSQTYLMPLDQVFASGAASLVRAQSARTYRHQIRLHLAHSGHPLWGDELYGSTEDLSQFLPASEGFFLHAESISFWHPVSGALIGLEAKSAELEQIKCAA